MYISFTELINDYKAKPCPACLSRKLSVEIISEEYFVSCVNHFLKCGFLVRGFGGSSVEDAVKLWNEGWEETQSERKKNCRASFGRKGKKSDTTRKLKQV